MLTWRRSATLRATGALFLVVVAAHEVLAFVWGRWVGLPSPAGALLEGAVVAAIAVPVIWFLVVQPLQVRARGERRTTEQALEETEERYRRLVELAPDAVFVACDGLVAYANAEGARLLGERDGAALRDRAFLDFIHSDDRPAIVARMRRMGETGGPVPPIAQRLVRADGSLVHAEARACPIRFGGKPAVLAVVRDIDDRVGAEERLRVQAAALDAAANEILIVDRDFRIEWLNQAFATATGYTLDEVAGRTPEFLRDGTPDAGSFADTTRALTSGASWHGEVTSRHKDGATRRVAVSFSPIRDGRGAVVRFVGVGQDVTERRALEAQLRQAQKMEAVGQLAGGIAHDFNNLLTTIFAASGLLEEQLPEAAPSREEVRLVRYAAERGAELTQKLLAFSRRQRLEIAPLDLAAAVAGFARMIRRVLREDIVVSVAPDADPVVARADAGAVEEILMNLVTNARDAMPSGGRLTIATERRALDAAAAALHGCPRAGDYAVLSVSDTGSGMSAETQRRIFEPFFTTKPVGSGTGLGLSMVYGLVKQQGGGVSVYSEVGRGATFRVYLPAAAAAEAVQGAGGRPAAREARGGTETILLVEDEVGLRRAAQRVLERHGYTVVVAEDGAEALKILARQDLQVALVVSDVVMPRIGGAQLYRALRERGSTVPVLLTSGYTARDVEAAAELKDRLPFLAKPWTVAELLKGVRGVLDTPEGGPRS